MVELNEVLKQDIVFEDAEAVKCASLLGKKLVVKQVVSRKGQDGEFYIIQADQDGKDVSFSCGGKVVMKKLSKVAESFNQAISDEVLRLKEPLSCTIVERKSEEGRVYYDLE